MAGEGQDACQWACTALPASVGTIPMASRASAPRCLCTAEAVTRAGLAAGSPWSCPGTRRPLSSKCPTGSAVRHGLFTGAVAGLTATAISWVAATMGPAPTGGPERSAHIALVLAQGIH
jgi:hypothetical protein